MTGFPWPAVAWDIDGTLVDSEPLHDEALAFAMRSVGIAPPSDLHERVLGIAAWLGVGAALLFASLYVRLDAIHSFEDLLNLKRTVLGANGIWIAGSLAVFLAIHFLIQYLWLRRIGKFGMLLGNLVIWALAASASVVFLPNAQYIFLWPLIGCTIGVLTEVFTARKKPGTPPAG